MIKISAVVLSTVFAFILHSPFSILHSQGYSVEYDLTKISDDKLHIRVELPPITENTATFVFPVIAPGTYEFNPWYKLVRDFKALDANGNQLPVSRTTDSQFVLVEGARTRVLDYWMEDSFDNLDSALQVFHPAGTNFEDSIVQINHTGIVGYVDGMQDKPYTVSVKRFPYMYCATALTVTQRSADNDVYTAENYDALVDGPVLFCLPDTATLEVNGMKVLVALAHRGDTRIAQNYAKSLSKVTHAIAKFLDTMPVDRYAFLMYLWNGDTNTVRYMHYASGALEHNFSSMYFWRYTSKPFGLSDIAGHEFLHILVPLNLHSVEIDRFNFRTPAMSEHIWLYEGVTEYFANQSLLRGGELKEKAFIGVLNRWAGSFRHLPKDFNLISFSKDILSKENQEIYPNIYFYGPLNGLLLDVVLRESTQGKMGLLELVQTLMKKYGPSKPFDDDELFDEIGDASTDEAQEYCEEHINSDKRLPVAEILNKIGISYQDSVVEQRWSFGIKVPNKASDSLFYIEPDSVNPLGVAEGDILQSVNREKVTFGNYSSYSKLISPDNDEEITVFVKREGMSIELKAKPYQKSAVRKNMISINENATPEQVALRNQVLYGVK